MTMSMPLVIDIQNLDILEDAPKSSRRSSNHNENEPDNNVSEPSIIIAAQQLEGEGAIIVVGDNDSVSSLDSADSFAFDLDDETPKRLRELSSSRFQQSTREQPSRRRRPNRMSRSNRMPKKSLPPRAITSPNMPRRQATREYKPVTKRPSVQRVNSNPELQSPKGSNQNKTILTELPMSLAINKNSVRSMSCLEYDHQEEDGGLLHPHSYHHGQQSSSRWQSSYESSCGDSKSTANTGSRWSASTGTNARSMNTAQLDQLSTVPRFPRRQKTGQGMKSLRNASTHSQDSNGDLNVSVHTPTPAPRKRPQLPNRQKSFGRDTLTMNQAAQVALAKASAHGTTPPTTTEAPIKPRRSVSNDTSVEIMSRQKSLPDLSETKQDALVAPQLQLSKSLHASPRLPTRKASGQSLWLLEDDSGSTTPSVQNNFSWSLPKLPRRQTSHNEEMPPPKTNAIVHPPILQESMTDIVQEEAQDGLDSLPLQFLKKSDSKNDFRAKLPLRQMSLSERRDDDDNITEAIPLGVDDKEEVVVAGDHNNNGDNNKSQEQQDD